MKMKHLFGGAFLMLILERMANLINNINFLIFCPEIFLYARILTQNIY